MLIIDIDATIAAVDSMRKNFDTIPHEEAIIKAGFILTETSIDGRPKQNISEYLGSITRLQSSINTLSRSKILPGDSLQSQMVFLFHTLD